MAILAECSRCRRRQSAKNKKCKCGNNLDKAKSQKKVRYWIDYPLPGGKVRRESVGAFEGLNAYSITDAQAAMVCGVVPVAATDYSDLGAQQVATVRGVGLEVHPVNGTSLWVAPKSMGTGTYATGRLTVRVGLLRG